MPADFFEFISCHADAVSMIHVSKQIKEKEEVFANSISYQNWRIQKLLSRIMLISMRLSESDDVAVDEWMNA